MVAGMLMPLDQLRAIYEVLFREGVMVAKKDRRPRSLHPHVPGATNLQVMRAMASLRARGLVRETFAWRHFYWYLTNEGMAHLRQYLHLPPEIVPASLQRVRRPVAMVMPARRTPHAQSVQGPLGCPLKWGPQPAEDPAREERRVYRRKEPVEELAEPPVPPAAAPGNLGMSVLEPAPATGQRHLGPSCGGRERGARAPAGGLGWPAHVWKRRLCRQVVLCLPALGLLSRWTHVAPPCGLRTLGWAGHGGALGPLAGQAQAPPGARGGAWGPGLAGPAAPHSPGPAFGLSLPRVSPWLGCP